MRQAFREVPWFCTLEKRIQRRKKQPRGISKSPTEANINWSRFSTFWYPPGGIFETIWTRFLILPSAFWNSSDEFLEFFRLRFCQLSVTHFVCFFNGACQDLGESRLVDFKIFRARFEILPTRIWNSSDQLFWFFRREFWNRVASPFEPKGRG